MNKNNIKFYEELVNHLECKPSEAILIDDEKRNLNIARTLGFYGIHYYYTEKLIESLKKYEIKLE